jgi:hypothetical protein
MGPEIVKHAIVAVAMLLAAASSLCAEVPGATRVTRL